jgi:hypothetical protein
MLELGTLLTGMESEYLSNYYFRTSFLLLRVNSRKGNYIGAKDILA